MMFGVGCPFGLFGLALIATGLMNLVLMLAEAERVFRFGGSQDVRSWAEDTKGLSKKFCSTRERRIERLCRVEIGLSNWGEALVETRTEKRLAHKESNENQGHNEDQEGGSAQELIQGNRPPVLHSKGA